MLRGGEMNEKNCFDGFIAGLGFGVGGLSLVASSRRSRRPRRSSRPLQFKMRGLLKSRNPWILKQGQDRFGMKETESNRDVMLSLD